MAHTIRLGDVVRFVPACNCPPMCRPLARQLAGRAFQVVGTAELQARAALVLQPWPCLDPFPSYQLAPADCVRLGASLIDRDPTTREVA